MLWWWAWWMGCGGTPDGPAATPSDAAPEGSTHAPVEAVDSHHTGEGEGTTTPPIEEQSEGFTLPPPACVTAQAGCTAIGRNDAYLSTVNFDACGRVVVARRVDLVGGVSSEHRHFHRDKEGRIVEERVSRTAFPEPTDGHETSDLVLAYHGHGRVEHAQITHSAHGTHVVDTSFDMHGRRVARRRTDYDGSVVDEVLVEHGTPDAYTLEVHVDDDGHADLLEQHAVSPGVVSTWFEVNGDGRWDVERMDRLEDGRLVSHTVTYAIPSEELPGEASEFGYDGEGRLDWLEVSLGAPYVTPWDVGLWFGDGRTDFVWACP